MFRFTLCVFALGCAPTGNHVDASTADAPTTDASTADAQEELAPLPDFDAACIPPTGQEAGPCCEKVYCYTPDAGACEDAQVRVHEFVMYDITTPCQCGPASGPYDGVTHGAQCCYLGWAQSCQ